MKAWVDRKSFIHNLGHAAAVYYGFLKHPKNTYLYEVLSDPEVKGFARSAMIQSGKILQKMYPGEFSDQDIIAHIDDLLFRFQNKNLGDTVFRVGMDLFRKLGKEDRLAGAIHLGIKHNMPYNKILYALVCGMYFRAKDEHNQLFSGDSRFAEMILTENFKNVLEKICGFNPTIHQEVIILSENYRSEILTKFKT
jgi:mannitol-1-phosphate 5-dehydrogenase